MRCTCGAKSVNSPCHSSWCDFVSGRSARLYENLLNAPTGTYLVITGISFDPDAIFNELKNKYNHQIMMTVEDYKYKMCKLYNGSDVYVINAWNIPFVRKLQFSSIFVAQDDFTDDIIMDMHSSLESSGTFNQFDYPRREIVFA